MRLKLSRQAFTLMEVMMVLVIVIVLSITATHLHHKSSPVSTTPQSSTVSKVIPSSPTASLNPSIPDVTQLHVGDHIGTLTVTFLGTSPGNSSPISNTNYDIVFSGTVTSQATLLVGDTDGTPVYTLDSLSNSALWQQLPTIGSVKPSAAQTMIGPSASFSMQHVFGTYNNNYMAGSRLTAIFGIGNLEYIYRPATGTNGYVEISAGLLSAQDPSIMK